MAHPIPKACLTDTALICYHKQTMKYLIRVFLFHLFALWTTSQLFPAFVVRGGWQTIVTAGLVLSLLTLLVQPILKILFIPITLLTFGLLSWLINVIVLYLLTLFVPDVMVIPWLFPGWRWQGFSVPAYQMSYPMALVVTSIIITVCTNILHGVTEQ